MVWEQGLELIREFLHSKNYFKNGSKEKCDKNNINNVQIFLQCKKKGRGKGNTPTEGRKYDSENWREWTVKAMQSIANNQDQRETE